MTDGESIVENTLNRSVFAGMKYVFSLTFLFICTAGFSQNDIDPNYWRVFLENKKEKKLYQVSTDSFSKNSEGKRIKFQKYKILDRVSPDSVRTTVYKRSFEEMKSVMDSLRECGFKYKSNPKDITFKMKPELQRENFRFYFFDTSNGAKDSIYLVDIIAKVRNKEIQKKWIYKDRYTKLNLNKLDSLLKNYGECKVWLYPKADIYEFLIWLDQYFKTEPGFINYRGPATYINNEYF